MNKSKSALTKVLIARYLWGRKRFKLKFSHLLSLVGVFIGIVALLVVSTVMNGFREDMMKRIIDSKAEIRIHAEDSSGIDYEHIIDKVRKIDGVRGAAPVINNDLLLFNRDNVVPVTCMGIDFESHQSITGIDKQIRLGSIRSEEFDKNGIIIGLDLSLSLNVTIGQKVQLNSPLNTEPSPFGLLPRSRQFVVQGIFVSGMPEYDKTIIYISLPNAAYFSGKKANESDMILVRTNNPANSFENAVLIRNVLDDKSYRVEDWSSFDASMYQAMKLEKSVMMTVLALMLIISGLNMACNSIKMVTEKKIEIGIMKALGMTDKDVGKLFWGVNLSICLSGTIAGLFVSLAFIYLQSRFHLVQIPVPGFPMQWLPVLPNLSDFIIYPLIVILISILATVVPLARVKKIEAIKIIRDYK